MSLLKTLCISFWVCVLMTSAQDVSPHLPKSSEAEQRLTCQNLIEETALTPGLSILRLICKTASRFKEIREENEKKNDEPLLLVTTRFELMSVNSTSLKTQTIVKPVNDTVAAVDYDPVSGSIYYTCLDGGIKRVKRDGMGYSEKETIAADAGAIGLAVDWIARNLYWVNEVTDQILVSRLDGSSQKILIKDGLDKPRSIAVDPFLGKLFWTEWGSNPRIAKASLDGSNVETLASSGIKWPNGLALDLEQKLVYFGDAKTDKLEVLQMDGSGRRILLRRDVTHIFSMSYLDGQLYWTDWQSRSLERMSVNETENRSTLLQGQMLMGVKATYWTPMAGTNVCSKDNGGCSHLCFFTGQEAKCGCPDVDTAVPCREP